MLSGPDSWVGDMSQDCIVAVHAQLCAQPCTVPFVLQNTDISIQMKQRETVVKGRRLAGRDGTGLKSQLLGNLRRKSHKFKGCLGDPQLLLKVNLGNFVGPCMRRKNKSWRCG